MKRVYVAFGTALLCSTALFAQSSMDKDKPMKDGMAMKAGTVMVTGCVAQADDMKQFKLTNAMMAPMPMGKMSSDAAMKPDAPAPEMPAWYALDGGDLKPHLGHKVEVSGTMEKKPMMDHDKMAKPGAMADKDKMAQTTGTPMMAGKIKVTSVKMLAATCM